MENSEKKLTAQELNSDTSATPFFAPTAYSKVITFTKNFIALANAVTSPSGFKNMPLGIYFSDTDLRNIATLSKHSKGVAMLFGLETANDPSSITVSFVGADADSAGTLRISDDHKKLGADGEETWTNKIPIKTGSTVIKAFLEDPNTL